jgi:hypothetical protein
MSTHTPISTKQWLEIKRLKKIARRKLINLNHGIYDRSSDKNKAENETNKALTSFDTMIPLIQSKNIAALDEALCDYLVDHVYELDNQDSLFVSAIMALYNTVTGYRA